MVNCDGLVIDLDRIYTSTVLECTGLQVTLDKGRTGNNKCSEVCTCTSKAKNHDRNIKGEYPTNMRAKTNTREVHSLERSLAGLILPRALS